MLNTITLPITPDYDPRRVEADELARTLEAMGEEALMEQRPDFASLSGDISEYLNETQLANIGSRCVEDYTRDKSDREDWEKTAEEALEIAAQESTGGQKDYPWPNASNIRFPILATAMLQFNARAYPAVVKGDQGILCKVMGNDDGVTMIGPDGKIQMGMEIEGQMLPIPPGAPLPEGAQPVPMFQVPPGAKMAKAARVSQYMNHVLFHKMPDWESDTDALLMQLPVVGCAFRKMWRDGEQKSATCSALRIIVPQGARSVETTPRLTEERPDIFVNEIRDKMRSGYYRSVELNLDKETDTGRMLLEQHRYIDLDDDGVDEPYIVTVDKETNAVLRIEPNYGPESIKRDDTGMVMCIKPNRFYIKYSFFPDPRGNFYDLGLGHLLKQGGAVIDTAINQLMDAGHAQTAGGGFIASGVRLQSRGGGGMRYQPGVYKTVDVPGDVLRNAIVEKTLPNVSPVTFQILDLVLGAMRDLSGVKDVITGDASNNGQVGTTLALIEQGLQVFNAIYKRCYRALTMEYQLLFDNIGRYGTQADAQEYAELLDDPQANFANDFTQKGLDVRPVSDPLSVTRIQKMAKAQFLQASLPMAEIANIDAQEVMRRVYEAADIQNIDKLFRKPGPPPEPDPRIEADVMKTMSDAGLNAVKAEREKFDIRRDAMELGAASGFAG